MTSEAHKLKTFPLVIPILLGITLILMGVLGIITSENTLDILLSGFFFIPGSWLLLYSFKEFKQRKTKGIIVRHDERSLKNRLKATDRSFRFLYISLMALIVLNAINFINNIAFVALTGPIIAVGISLQYFLYYWYERRG
jgi:di/tricarboxylate transporter